MSLYFFASEGLQFTKCVLKTKKNKKKAAEGEMYTFVLVFSLYIPVTCPHGAFFHGSFQRWASVRHLFLKCRQTQGLEVVTN